MLNKSRRLEIDTLLARQLGHITRSGSSYEEGLDKLKKVADGELATEVEAFNQHYNPAKPPSAQARVFSSPIATLRHLAEIARSEGGNPSAILGHAEEILGPLGESYRVYWSGISAFLWYVSALGLMLFAILVIFSVFVFPQIQELYSGSTESLPPLTIFTMNTLGVLGDLFFFLVISGIAAIAFTAIKIRSALMRLAPLTGNLLRIPGLSSLCNSYNQSLLLNLSRLLTCTGVSSETSLKNVWQPHYPGVKLSLDSVERRGDLRTIIRKDPISGALMLASLTGTLDAELHHLAASAETLFADKMVKVREQFTLVAQLFIGIVIATMVISMYLPIFKMGSIY